MLTNDSTSFIIHDFYIVTTPLSNSNSSQDWRRVRQRFVECFLLQKTAYRRANGGSTAPSLHEDVDPRFITERERPPAVPWR